MLLNDTGSLHGVARSATMAINVMFAVVITGFYDSDMAVHAAVPEVQVTKARAQDFEFNATNALLTFIDNNRRLWVGKVNTATGAFEPPSGRGVLVDTGAASPSAFGNGPEWLYSASGDEIVYTRYLPNQPATAANARIAHAVPNAAGVYVPGFVDSTTPYVIPIGSLDAGDTYPRISYQQPEYNGIYWREINMPETEEFVPQSDLSWATWYTRRWVPDRHAQVFSAPIVNSNGVIETQSFLYNTDTKVLEQLSYDDGVKQFIFMWQAPEYNNEYIFFVQVNKRELRIYRRLDVSGNGDLQWTAINSIHTPQEYPYLWSPEPFTHNGKSYIFMVVSKSSDPIQATTPTQIALTDINALEVTLLTDVNSLPRIRQDPEVFITEKGPFIYYNRLIPATSKSPAQSDGVWRVDPGLGPAN